VARINPLKLKQDAAKATNDGRYDKAIELLGQIVRENPRDANTLNQMGFLYEKLNNTKAANEQYTRVANLYASDGFYLKAIACWKKVLKNDAALLDAHLNLGDLYAKQGLTAEAKTMLGEAFDECVKRGRHREAGEVLRRMADLDPSDMKVRIRLAELYAREGQNDQAAEEFLALADGLAKKGHRQEALQLLEKGLKIGKRSPRLLAEVARVHLVQKDFATALPYLEEARRGAPRDHGIALRLAETYLGSGRLDDARSVLEERLAEDGTDQEAKSLLGRVFLAMGRPNEAYEQLLPALEQLVEHREIDRAVSLLRPIAELDPPHFPALGKLVELYRMARNEAMVVQTYSQMVEAYLRDEEMEQAASVLEVLVQLEPHNEQHRSKLEWIRRQGVVPAPPESVPGGVDASAPGRAAAGPPAGSLEGAIELSGPLSPEDQEFIDEHLSEGRVFRKYGLTDKARDQFEAALSRFPDNLDARRELIELHRDREERDKAAFHLRALAQILRLRGDEAGAAEAEARAGQGGAPEVPEGMLLPEEPTPSEAPPPPEGLTLEPEAPVAAAGALEDEVEISVEVEAPAASPQPVEEADLELVEVPDESSAPVAQKPFLDEADLAGGGGEYQRDFMEGGDFDLGEADEAPGAPLPTEQGRGLVPQATPAAEPISDVPEDLQRVLADVEQYVSLGFVEDAKEVLQELGNRYDDHPALLTRLAELGLEAPGAAEPSAPPVEVPMAPPEPARAAVAEVPGAVPEEPLQLGEGFLEFTPAPPISTGEMAEDLAPAPAGPVAGEDGGEGFDLASELGGLFGAQSAVTEEEAEEGTDLGDDALTDLFREFRKGVDKQLGNEDYETRYNLGIAYKEMGLVDEAVAEFQLAAKDDARLLECASMLGICFIEKGMPKLAVKWFEKGLQAQGRTEQEYMGLRYDLADALEISGERERALEIFTELYGQDASFRDVAEKVRQLNAGA
jgi:pilus assembly protein FimV